jgi:transposase
MKFHPVTERYPLLEGKAREEMLADLRENGLRVPIVVWRGWIIDGRNRYLLCDEAGIEPEYAEWNGEEEDLEAYVESLNEHRRHLTLEQLEERRRQRLARVAEKRAEGKSTRQIAEEVGISQSQVVRDLGAADSGEPRGSPEITGRDGKTYNPPKKPLDIIRQWATEGKLGKRAAAELEALGKSAHKRFVQLVKDGSSPADALKALSREPGNDRPPPPPPKPAPPKGELRDQAGNVVPDRLRDVFADDGLPNLIDELEQVEAMVRPQSWIDRAAKLCDHHGFILIDKFSEHAWQALQSLQLAREALAAGLPHAVCPKCQGAERNGTVCRGCRGHGHVPHTRYTELSAS